MADRDRALTFVQVPRARQGRYVRPANVKKAQRVSSFSRIYRARNCNGLCIKHKAEPPAGEREAIPIKTSPIFRAYN